MLSDLGNALAALAKETHGDQAVRLADGVLAQMKQTTDAFALPLQGNALADLAKETDGDQAAALANRVLAQMQRGTDARELSGLGDALAALGADPGEQSSRSALLPKLASVPGKINCGALAPLAARQDLSLLIDMLKWPICGGSRDGVMLRIAELENSDTKAFETFHDPNDRSTFQADLRKFVAWLKQQKDPQGKSFEKD